MKVRIYVEGGGAENQTLAQCREAFHRLFDRCCAEKLRPKFIACGSRSAAYQDFCAAIENHPSEYPILLVDSEEPIGPAFDAWTHLKDRKGDKWDKPAGASREQAHLMVQCMESWFLADKKELATFYGENFSASSLPNNPRIEDVPKDEMCSALANSTRKTQKGKYHKVRHGFAILSRIDFGKVCEKSTRAKEFRDQVLRRLGE